MRRTLVALGTTLALTLGPASVAAAQSPVTPAETTADDNGDAGLWGLLGLLGLTGLAGLMRRDRDRETYRDRDRATRP